MNTTTPPYTFIAYTGINSMILKGRSYVKHVNELAEGKVQ